jgi:hypothetical protein
MAQVIRFQIIHSVLTLNSRRSFDASITIPKLKDLLYRSVGTPSQWMHIEVRNFATNEVLITFPEDGLNAPSSSSTTLEESLVAFQRHVGHDETVGDQEGEKQPDFILSIQDLDPEKTVENATKEGEGSGEGFKLSEEAYNKREDTLKAWREKHLEKIRAKIGEKCKVTAKGQPARVGFIRFLGELEGHPGLFVSLFLLLTSGFLCPLHHIFFFFSFLPSH